MKHLFGGILLVAGTSIGAGMLALPVVTAAGGFLPALFIYLLSWGFMTATGLLLLELCLKLPPDANLIRMAGTYLGLKGKIFAWILYLFLFYFLSIAYVSGGGGLVANWFGIDPFISQILFVCLFSIPIYVGAWMVDRLNWVLMTGLILSYLSFAVFGMKHVHFEYLKPQNWTLSFFALPVIFTSFSYQGVIPSLTAYMKRDAKLLRITIIGGTSLCFLIYVLWELLILGIVPQDALIQTKLAGLTAVHPLKDHLKASNVIFVSQTFAFFAIATSFLGVNLGLLDFLADGLTLPKKGLRKVFLASLTFLPPLIISLTNPRLFLTALKFAGGIGCALLLGFLPTVMVWISRYKREGHMGAKMLFGGKTLLILLFLFVFLELIFEIIPDLLLL